MPHEVIMPALGMAQDTGLIVAWRKSAGDEVAADDVLFEVETDKSTMEVEAGADGFVAGLLAEAGEEVPVGRVIATISREKPANPIHASATTAVVAPAQKQPEVPAERPKAETASPVPRSGERAGAVPVAFAGRVLASPKARRLAAEQGLDLARLAASGHPMPLSRRRSRYTSSASRPGHSGSRDWFRAFDLEGGRCRFRRFHRVARWQGECHRRVGVLRRSEPAGGDRGR